MRCRVNKPFTDGAKVYATGDIVDTDGWRLARQLVEQRYITPLGLPYPASYDIGLIPSIDIPEDGEEAQGVEISSYESEEVEIIKPAKPATKAKPKTAPKSKTSKGV